MTKLENEFYVSVNDCLIYLEEIGWTELIESCWIEEVKNDLFIGFPDISEDVLNKTLELVLV